VTGVQTCALPIYWSCAAAIELSVKTKTKDLKNPNPEAYFMNQFT